MRTAENRARARTLSGRLRRYCLPACQLVLLAMVLQSGRAPAAPAVSLAVIVNPGSSVTALSFTELASIFTRATRTWKDGTAIRALNLQAGSLERIEFDRVILDMGPERSAQFWIDRQVRGEEGAPKAIAQADIVVSLVGTMNGALGYVPENKVDDKVRVVARIRGGKLVAP
jgi:hypothetical protein